MCVYVCVYVQGRTSVFVAHRLSTAAQCDQIVVLAGGRVVEAGTEETHIHTRVRAHTYTDRHMHTHMTQRWHRHNDTHAKMLVHRLVRIVPTRAGTHSELLAKQGLYAEMWTRQAAGLEDNL